MTSFTRVRLLWPGITALSLLAGNCLAQDIGSYPSANPAAIRAHAEFLGSDLLEGRATGSRGYELAAAYVAAQFRQYGLTPVSESGYLQSVPLVEATVVLPGSTASLKRDNSTINFEFSKDYLPSANFFNANASLTAPLAFAGYGIEAPELKYNDFADLDLQGRIAVIVSGAPERFNEQARSYYAWRDTKYASLVKQGALGVIEIDAHGSNQQGAGQHDSNQWERAVAMSWVSDMRRMNSEDQPDEPFPELKLRFRFNAEAGAQLFGNGHAFEPTLQTLKNGEPQSFALPGAMTLSATTGLRRIESNNVVAMLRGADARLQKEYVLVTANLDHLGRGAAVNGDSIYNGFQRNAVGVAMLLDMARSMAAAGVRPKRSIVFAAVTAGEKGAQGLRQLLTAGSPAARTIVASVVLDTPLPLTATSDVLATGADQSSLGVNLAAAASTQNLRLIHANAAPFTLINANMTPLVRANIPVIALHGGVRARDPRVDASALQSDWLQQHDAQPSDDMRNAPLDEQAARDLTNLNMATVLRLANAAERPTWYRSSLIHRKLRDKN